MKKAIGIVAEIIRTVFEIIMWGCTSFTGVICVFFAEMYIEECSHPVSDVDKFWGHNTHWKAFMATKTSVGICVQLLGLCMCIAVLQYVFFSGKVLKRTPYLVRVGLFGVLSFGACVWFADMSNWFKMNNTAHWMKFVGIFLTAYVGIILLMEVYFRIQGIRYNEALGRHQKRKESGT